MTGLSARSNFHTEVAEIVAAYLTRLVARGVPLTAAVVLAQDYQKMITVTLYQELQPGSEETPLQ